MNETKKYGNEGEKLAAKFLKKKKYKIIAKNYTCKIGEIDIIAKDKDVMVFVEVKRRHNDDFGVPSQNVNYTKQNKIIQVAKYYMVTEHIDFLTRFDVVEITGEKINHIEGAFYANNH
ncbi:MAG: YraN family protein [Clostridia bacterium]